MAEYLYRPGLKGCETFEYPIKKENDDVIIIEVHRTLGREEQDCLFKSREKEEFGGMKGESCGLVFYPTEKDALLAQLKEGQGSIEIYKKWIKEKESERREIKERIKELEGENKDV